jgi:hypothetical protein
MTSGPADPQVARALSHLVPAVQMLPETATVRYVIRSLMREGVSADAIRAAYNLAIGANEDAHHGGTTEAPAWEALAAGITDLA